MSDAESKVREIIINELGVELVMAFEEEFGFDIPDEDAETLRTVGDAISYMKKRAADAS